MYNWKNMCSAGRFDELHEELRNSRGKYILDDVKMPDECNNAIITIEFMYYSDSLIKVACVGAPHVYTGYDEEIHDWLTDGILEFDGFQNMDRFLKKFGRNVSVTQRESVPITNDDAAHERRMTVHIYDPNAVAVPTEKSYIDVDGEKLYNALIGDIFGQDEQIAKIVHLVHNHLGKKRRSRPIAIFLYGPTGVGKTQVVKLLVEKLNEQIKPKQRFFHKVVDCSQFQNEEDISRLTGAAPGYIGFNEPGVFSCLEDYPNTVFVFDEIEKGAPNITQAIMQAMDNGRMQTNGKTLSNGCDYYDLSHSLIFFTSNIILEDKKRLGFDTNKEHSITRETSSNIATLISSETREAKDKLVETGRFKREVVGRMAAIIKFSPLTGDVIKNVSAKSIQDVAEDHFLCVEKIDPGILQEYINATYIGTSGYGARNLRYEASGYFDEPFMAFSRTHEDNTRIHISGTLNNPIVEEV